MLRIKLLHPSLVQAYVVEMVSHFLVFLFRQRAVQWFR